MDLKSQILSPLEGEKLVSMLYRNSVGQHAPTALVSTHDTSESKDSGVSDKDPVLAQHAEQEAFTSTENVLPVHGILVRNPTVLLEKSHAGELSLSGEPECLSLQSDGSTHVQNVQEEGFPSAHAFLSSRRLKAGGHPERIFGENDHLLVHFLHHCDATGDNLNRAMVCIAVV